MGLPHAFSLEVQINNVATIDIHAVKHLAELFVYIRRHNLLHYAYSLLLMALGRLGEIFVQTPCLLLLELL